MTNSFTQQSYFTALTKSLNIVHYCPIHGWLHEPIRAIEISDIELLLMRTLEFKYEFINITRIVKGDVVDVYSMQFILDCANTPKRAEPCGIVPEPSLQDAIEETDWINAQYEEWHKNNNDYA